MLPNYLRIEFNLIQAKSRYNEINTCFYKLTIIVMLLQIDHEDARRYGWKHGDVGGNPPDLWILEL